MVLIIYEVRLYTKSGTKITLKGGRNKEEKSERESEKERVEE